MQVVLQSLSRQEARKWIPYSCTQQLSAQGHPGEKPRVLTVLCDALEVTQKAGRLSSEEIIGQQQPINNNT
jgi:hypothetical protein